MAGLLRTVYELFPAHAREFLKRSLKAEGHSSSWLDRIKAHDHARGKKRLDLICESIAVNLAAAGITSLRGASCLEFGAGYVPSEALAFHLLGAERCIATDYNAIANLAQIADAARSADRNRVLSALAPFADGADIEQRLDAILRVEADEARAMMVRLIGYAAPFDMSAAALEPGFDFIHSISVFEHLPPLLAERILTNLRVSLRPNGRMIHEIDLRDHLDLEGAPFAFLSRADPYDAGVDFDVRGNRIRKPRWMEIFTSLPDTSSHLIYQRNLPAEALPKDLIEDLKNLPPNDLLASWIGVFSLAAAT